jgi:hippurate hydrolase
MQDIPGAHILLGSGDIAGLHNNRYDFNDDAIPYGVAVMATVVEKKLPSAL